MLMLPLSLCLYECWERMLAQVCPAEPILISSPDTDTVIYNIITSDLFFLENESQHHIVMQRPLPHI